MQRRLTCSQKRMDSTNQEPLPAVARAHYEIFQAGLPWRGMANLYKLGQDPCPCAFAIVDMVPYTISKLSAKSQFYAIQTADNTDGKVTIEIILLLENNKMLPRKIKTEKK